MKKLIPLLLAMLLLTGCQQSSQPAPEVSPPAASGSDAAQSAPPSTEPEPPEDPLDTLLSSMTLEEQVGQLFFVRCPAENALTDVTDYHLGGYILFGRDTKDKTANELIQNIAAWQRAAMEDTGIPLLMGVDEEGGTVVRVSSNPHLRSAKFPAPRTLWQQGAEAVADDTREKDTLLHALGFNVNLAPVADVSTDPGDFIYARTTGQDAAGAEDYVSLVVETMCRDGMGSVLKHFPGYGNNADTHTGVAVDPRPYETFTDSDFLPFRAGIAAGQTAGGQRTAVLVSHNIVQCMDPDLPASLSPEVHRILRQELGFDGVAMTDDLAMDAVAAYAADGAVAVMALQAGNDLIITTDYRSQIPKVLAAVENGTLEESVIRQACRRVLQWKIDLGLVSFSG